MVLSSWLQKWFYSIQLPSPLYFLIVNIISWNLLSSQIEVVFLTLIWYHHIIAFFLIQVNINIKRLHKNFTSQNSSHSDIFLGSKWTNPLINLLTIGTRRHVHKLIKIITNDALFLSNLSLDHFNCAVWCKRKIKISTYAWVLCTKQIVEYFYDCRSSSQIIVW